jgi:restriction system protein
MLGLLTHEGADGVIIVTSGMYTQEAQNFAANKAIDLVNGAQLLEMVRNIQGKHQTTEFPALQNKIKRCPRCGSELVIREAKRRQSNGEIFWGCSNFPQCRHSEKYQE